MTDWQVCPWCPPDDCEWPSSHFTVAVGSYPEGQRPCNACMLERFPRRNAYCACGKRMRTKGAAQVPTCHACRRVRREAREERKRREREARRCPTCGKDRAVATIGRPCGLCREAERRVSLTLRPRNVAVKCSVCAKFTGGPEKHAGCVPRPPLPEGYRLNRSGRLVKIKPPRTWAGFRFSRRYEEAA